jgi:hypothetical protein
MWRELEEENVKVIGSKARREEFTRKKTEVGG